MQARQRTTSRSGPLGDVVVVEIGGAVAENAGRLLGEMGSLVIKVEPREGSASRANGPFAVNPGGVTGSIPFWTRNITKLSLAVDLTQNDGIRVLQRLVERADVVLEGRDDTLVLDGTLGDRVKAWNPNAIHAVISPFGEDSPWSAFPSSTLTALALGGIAGVSGYGAADQSDGISLPIAPAGDHAKHYGGVHAVIGIIAALIERHTSGETNDIDVALHDAIAVGTESSVPLWLFDGREVERQTGRHAWVDGFPQTTFMCRDGRYICGSLENIYNGRRWAALLDWMSSEGLQEDLGDSRFNDTATRQAESTHLLEVLGRFCLQQDSKNLFLIGQSKGIAWAPIMSPDELVGDEFLDEREFFIDVEIESHGRVRFPGVPYQGIKSAYDMPGLDVAPPEIGQDSRLVLEWLGFSSDEIRSLLLVGAI